MAEDINIVHTLAGETMLTGTRSGDGLDEVLKANRWRWSTFLDAWEVSRSGEELGRAVVIDATAQALRELGRDVSVQDVAASEYRYSLRWVEGWIAMFEARLEAWDQHLPVVAEKRPLGWIRRFAESELEFWRGSRDQLVERGSRYFQGVISKGDYVRISGHWREVVRANRRSVSVRTETRVDKAPYHRITDHRLADDLDEGYEPPAP